MALYDTTRPMVDGRQTQRSAGIFAQLVAWYHTWSETRATREALYKLSDRDLEDVGLTRGDIDRVTGYNYR
ncbi:MAG: DUF1127 domain-containing protein [Pseudomonadota bacterium]